MFKLFCAAMVVTAFAAQSARAGDCCCSDQAAVEKSADHQAKGADQTQQAQANSQNRSFSYEPATVERNRQSTRGMYRYGIQYDPKIIGSYGLRPASDKAVGNY